MAIEKAVVFIKLDALDQRSLNTVRPLYAQAGLDVDRDIIQEVWVKVRPDRLGLTLPSSERVEALLVSGEGAIAKARELKGSFSVVYSSGSMEEARRLWLLLIQADYDDYWSDMAGRATESRPTGVGW